jgi:hypothetical protein
MEWARWLYHHVEKRTNHKMNTNQSPGEYQWASDKYFFSQGSHACRHTSPCCVDQHLVVRAAKRCCTSHVHTIGHCKNLPTSKVTQWHEQSELPFSSPSGKVQDLSQPPESATNNRQHMPKLIRCSKLSSWRQPPRVIRNLQPQWSLSATRCNHSSKYT